MCHKGFIKDGSVHRVKSSRKRRECENEDKVGMAIRKATPENTVSLRGQTAERSWRPRRPLKRFQKEGGQTTVVWGHG